MRRPIHPGCGLRTGAAARIDNPGSIAYILQDCEASVLIVGQAAQWAQIRAVGTPFPSLRAVVVTDECPDLQPHAASTDGPALGSLVQWLGGAGNR